MGNSVTLILVLLLCAGCAGLPYAGMTAEQIQAVGKIKDASVIAVCGYYAGAKVTTVTVNVDKGLPVGVTVDDCKVIFDGKDAPK